jgi:hypothetical protein
VDPVDPDPDSDPEHCPYLCLPVFTAKITHFIDLTVCNYSYLGSCSCFYAGLNVSVAVVQQYFIPSVVNSLIPFASMDLSLATERLLKVRPYLPIERESAESVQRVISTRSTPWSYAIVSRFRKIFFFFIFFVGLEGGGNSFVYVARL